MSYHPDSMLKRAFQIMEKEVHTQIQKVEILGCPFENGIMCMQQFRRGVLGTKFAPQAIKSKLGRTVRGIDVDQYNTGYLADTITAHTLIKNTIKETSAPFIVIGGDHSITYPIIKGMSKNSESMGIIYFDAHLDVRPLEGADGTIISSGNSFRRIIEDPKIKIEGGQIAAIGIQPGESEIYKIQRAFAHDTGMNIIEESHVHSAIDLEELMKDVIAGIDREEIYLSIDIDALGEKWAPGVSAVNKNGLTLDQVVKMINCIPRIVAADITEASARSWSHEGVIDHDGKVKLDITAQTAAFLIQDILIPKMNL